MATAPSGHPGMSPQCAGSTKRGEPCRMPRLTGSCYCYGHDRHMKLSGSPPAGSAAYTVAGKRRGTSVASPSSFAHCQPSWVTWRKRRTTLAGANLGSRRLEPRCIWPPLP